MYRHGNYLLPLIENMIWTLDELSVGCYQLPTRLLGR